MYVPIGVLLAAVLACVWPVATPLAAQQRCRYDIVDRERGYTQSTQTRAGAFIHYVSGGIDYRCPDGARILADSAAIFMGDNLAQLFGNVRFSDPQTELVARRADYDSGARRLQAWDQVRLLDHTNGAVITGDEMVLNRASPSRPLDRMIISGAAPHATVYLTEGGIESVVPYEVDADRFILEGRRFFRAGGNVVVDRATLHAVGDSLDFDQDLGVMSVFKGARVQDLSFDLTARTVTVLTPRGVVEEVLAREDAELTGEGVFLEAPAIRMFVQDNLVHRLVALSWIPPIPDSMTMTATDAPEASEPGAADDEIAALPPPGDSSDAGAGQGDPIDPGGALPPAPSAVAEGFRLWADSIDVQSPGQVLDRVIAVGRARSESITPPDSSDAEELPDVAREDWMEGDTIVVAFAPEDPAEAPPDDSTGARVEIESITAMGAARSLYRLAPADSSRVAAGGPQALHYVRAASIRILLEGGEVSRMEVEGQTSGFHFEPVQAPRPDTTGASAGSAVPAPERGRSAPAAARRDRLEASTGPIPAARRRR